MTICPHIGKACSCQPQEGVLCPHGEQPPYKHGPTKLPEPVELSETFTEPRLWSEAALHKLYAEGFEAGHEAGRAAEKQWWLRR